MKNNYFLYNLNKITYGYSQKKKDRETRLTIFAALVSDGAFKLGKGFKETLLKGLSPVVKLKLVSTQWKEDCYKIKIYTSKDIGNHLQPKQFWIKLCSGKIYKIIYSKEGL